MARSGMPIRDSVLRSPVVSWKTYGGIRREKSAQRYGKCRLAVSSRTRYNGPPDVSAKARQVPMSSRSRASNSSTSATSVSPKR